MFAEMAKVVYAARRAIAQGVVGTKDQPAPDVPVAFEDLSGGDREPFIAEVRSYLESGEPMTDIVGMAIVDALK